MRILSSVIVFCLAFSVITTGGVGEPFASEAKEVPVLNAKAPDRLPPSLDDRVIVPDLGCFWSFDLEDDDYKTIPRVVAPYGAFDALTLTLRAQNTLLENRKAHDVAKRAVQYALDEYGIGTLLDIDLRIARYDFEKRRPDLAQERLFFQEQPVQERSSVTFNFSSPNLNDHYTGNLPYYVRGGRVVRAWRYSKNEAGEILSSSIVDVTDEAVWDKSQYFVKNLPGYEVDSESLNELSVTFEYSEKACLGDYIACAVAFRYSYPDLFADETLALERELYEYYSDVPALGICKDEWGFPPCFDRVDNLNDFWYSERMRSSYANAYDNRDLIDDLFLAFKPRDNKDSERIDSIDRYRRLCGDRVVEYEIQNYKLTKQYWGKDAFVGAHCTWYPWPNILEMRKDGLMWWKAPRDVAQTDEYAPFCARNAMAKGCDSLWVNMFYARQVSPYIWEHWTSAASGGRVHIHQIYPRDENSPKNSLDPKLLPIIADGGVGKIRQKIRMLNLISNSPVDSPIAVVFGRFAASNPLRPEYKTVGWDLCDRFATRGYLADLIPIDEIRSFTPDGKKRWSVSDGYVCYGRQRYYTIILNGESASEKDDYNALRRLASGTKTEIVSLEPGCSDQKQVDLLEQTITSLKERGAIPCTPWVCDTYQFEPNEEISSRPSRKSVNRFIDGTILWIAAEKNDFGDPINLSREVLSLKNGRFSPEISASACGLLAVRFDEQSQLNACVASELKSLSIGDLTILLSDEEITADPIDVALWKTEDGLWKGVFQRKENKLPEALEKITTDWRYLQRR